jgi:hypothetical protein
LLNDPETLNRVKVTGGLRWHIQGGQAKVFVEEYSKCKSMNIITRLIPVTQKKVK